ncbi:MAG: dihydrodipicolinate synthase family protein [Fuerstiella sp.]|nr:dihydrodipicolinate synthase family protein [Fuerstiella sp.]
MFHDHDQELNLPAIRRHVQFLRDGGINEDTAVLLAGGAAGDFSTMSFSERLQVAETVIEASDGRVPVAMGAQTTNTRDVVELARAAEQLGADFIQVSPPFYFGHTEEDFFEFVTAAAQAADVGIIVYNTYWTSTGVSTEMVERLTEIPNVVGLKWATADSTRMTFEYVVAQFSDRLSIIDNQNRFLTSHILGARSIELHICNHWPQFGVQLWQLLEEQRYVEAQQEMMRVILPFMQLWAEMEQYTSGDGYLDKLCMELVGLDSSRCRPPTRDVRDKFREQTRQMLLDCGTPRVQQKYQ